MNDPNTDYVIKHEASKMKQDFLVTEGKKNRFVNEIKNGLGEEIKKEPNKPQKRVSIFRKLINLLG